MIKNPLIASMVFIYLSFSLSPAMADSYGVLNYGFLNDTPPQYFSDQDWKIFLKAEKRALNSYSDGSKLTWKNRTTGSNGYLIPSHTSKINGLPCRKLTIDTNANYRNASSTLTFCRVHGEWKGI